MTLNSFLIVHVHHACQIFFSIRRKEGEEKVETDIFYFFCWKTGKWRQNILKIQNRRHVIK